MSVPSLRQMVERNEARRERDAERYEALERDRCQLCHAEGPDKRTLLIRYFYAIHEMVPEAIDLRETDHDFDGYLLRTCKQCRGAFLGKMREWREERVALRDKEKDSDGMVHEDRTGMVPVREDGRMVYITEEECRRRKREPTP